MNEENLKKNIKIVVFSIGLLFLLLIVHISYLQIIASGQLVNNPLNSRMQQSSTQRGTIYDRHDEVLAYSKQIGQNKFRRIYPHKTLFAHITGYFGDKIGSTGIESYSNADLSGSNDPLRNLGAIKQLLYSQKGNNVRLTIDAKVQQAAAQALGNRNGAVIVLNPKTGAILAMLSQPSFDPNQLEEHWETVRTDSASPLLNRVTQGLYPPGSVLKTLIADAALAESVINLQDTYDCPGFLKFDQNYTMKESHDAVHGKVDLKAALTVSCNVTFAKLALKLGSNGLQKTFARFGFDKAFTNEINEAKIQLPVFDKLTQGELAQIGIGQGSLLVNPLRMALLASAFANKGVIMQPYLVDEILSANGDNIKTYKPEQWLEVTTAQRAALIEEFMQAVVTDGTATRVVIPGVKIAGKTGTAENANGDHAWFIGSATLPKQEIAFAIIVENGGGGGSVAAPIIKQIIVNSLMN